MWQQMAMLAGVGALGTLARWGLQGLVQRHCGAAFPWGTLVVNALGCFLFGIVFVAAEERALISSQTRLIILVGFMGAFTTFSSFAFETAALLRDSQWLFALGNVALQNVLGLACVFAGFAVGRWL
jgi:fluoride exporter